MQGTSVAAAGMLLELLPDRDYVPDEDAADVWLRATLTNATDSCVEVSVDDSTTAIYAHDEYRVLAYSAVLDSETPDAVVLATLDAVERDYLGIDRHPANGRHARNGEPQDADRCANCGHMPGCDCPHVCTPAGPDERFAHPVG